MNRLNTGIAALALAIATVTSCAASADSWGHRNGPHGKGYSHNHGHGPRARIVIVPRHSYYPRLRYYRGGRPNYVYVVPQYGAAPVYRDAPAVTLPPVTYQAPPDAARDGSYCREWQGQIVVAGQTEQAFGTACLQPDGSWQIQP